MREMNPGRYRPAAMQPLGFYWCWLAGHSAARDIDHLHLRHPHIPSKEMVGMREMNPGRAGG